MQETEFKLHDWQLFCLLQSKFHGLDLRENVHVTISVLFIMPNAKFHQNVIPW